MSECCGNPGVGDNPKIGALPDYNYYNPSEVRLYGRPSVYQEIFTMSSEDVEKNIENDLIENSFTTENAKMIASIAMKRVSLKLSIADIIGIVNQHIVVAVSDKGKLFTLPVELNIPAKDLCGKGDNYIKSIGVIYGYAYEGHCYKLPKPQIMFLPTDPKAIVEDVCACDCGYSPALGYAVWQIDKLERVVALDVRSDDLKTLVLDENLPGNRSPLAYAQTMALAPQRQRDY